MPMVQEHPPLQSNFAQNLDDPDSLWKRLPIMYIIYVMHVRIAKAVTYNSARSIVVKPLALALSNSVLPLATTLDPNF